MSCGMRLSWRHQLAPALDRQRAAQLGHAQREQVHDRDLGDERLRRGDADLQPGARVDDAVGVARGLRAHDVRHGQHGRAALAGEPHRGQRVQRLARLRDADHEVAGADHRVAVAVLGGDVHLDRDARPLLDRVAADQARVVGGAAGDDDDPLDAAQQLVVELGQVHAVGADRAVGDRLGDRVGLLVDLLEHERLVAALLGGVGVPVDLVRLALERLAVGGQELRALGRQDDELVVLERLDGARVREEGGDAGGEELLAVAAADDQRALLAGADQHAGLVGGDGDERVVAAQAVVGAARGLDEAVLVEVARRSGARSPRRRSPSVKTRARGEELLLELHVVLDDPVDHDVDAVLGVVVRVRVLLGHAPVRGPARVADAGRGRRREHGDAAAASSASRCATAAFSCDEVADGADASRGRPSAWIEIPAESYPRYSSFSRPARRTSCTGRCPTYPTMPHMAVPPSRESCIPAAGTSPTGGQILERAPIAPAPLRPVFRYASRKCRGG